jgi:hypothetical protein
LTNEYIDGFTGHYYDFGPVLSTPWFSLLIISSVSTLFFLLFGIYLYFYGTYSKHWCYPLISYDPVLQSSEDHELGSLSALHSPAEPGTGVEKTAVSAGLSNLTPLNQTGNKLYRKCISFYRVYSKPLCLLLFIISSIILIVSSVKYLYIQSLNTYSGRFAADNSLVTSYNKLFYGIANLPYLCLAYRSKYDMIHMHVAGEFGLTSTTQISTFLQTVSSTPSSLGGLLWSLRSHSRFGGFYTHHESNGFYSCDHNPPSSSLFFIVKKS